jgi:hypothetical protein
MPRPIRGGVEGRRNLRRSPGDDRAICADDKCDLRIYLEILNDLVKAGGQKSIDIFRFEFRKCIERTLDKPAITAYGCKHSALSIDRGS